MTIYQYDEKKSVEENQARALAVISESLVKVVQNLGGLQKQLGELTNEVKAHNEREKDGD